MTHGRKGYVSVLVLALVLALAYALHRDLWGQYQAYRSTEETVHQKREEVAEREAERQRMERQVDDLVKDPLEVEAAIRRIKGMVREDEVVYRITPDPKGPAAPAPNEDGHQKTADET